MQTRGSNLERLYDTGLKPTLYRLTHELARDFFMNFQRMTDTFDQSPYEYYGWIDYRIGMTVSLLPISYIMFHLNLIFNDILFKP